MKLMEDQYLTFNPLFIGSKDATSVEGGRVVRMFTTFNPLFIGSKDATAVVTLCNPL